MHTLYIYREISIASHANIISDYKTHPLKEIDELVIFVETTLVVRMILEFIINYKKLYN